mgnify:CR=1 FL=1
MDAKGFKKHLYIVLGSVSLALGITGILLPVLPTTPFLLLTGFFYLRSSARLYGWLANHKIFGAYIRNYMTYRAVPGRVKIAALLMLWAALSVSMVLINKAITYILLPAVGTGVSVHLFKLKTLESLQPEETAAQGTEDGRGKP